MGCLIMAAKQSSYTRAFCLFETRFGRGSGQIFGSAPLIIEFRVVFGHALLSMAVY